MRHDMGAYYAYEQETIDAAKEIPSGCVNEQSHAIGMQQAEPIIVALDCLLKYAKTYEKRFEGKLASDYLMGDCWIGAIRGVKGLLDGDGVIAMQTGRRTDTKDNGACFEVYAEACKIAGFNADTGDKE